MYKACYFESLWEIEKLLEGHQHRCHEAHVRYHDRIQHRLHMHIHRNRMESNPKFEVFDDSLVPFFAVIGFQIDENSSRPIIGFIWRHSHVKRHASALKNPYRKWKHFENLTHHPYQKYLYNQLYYCNNINLFCFHSNRF